MQSLIKLRAGLVAGMVISLATSCTSHKAANTNSREEDSKKIIFLVLEIKTDSATARNSIKLVKKSMSEGTLKKQDQGEGAYAANKLIIHHFEDGELKDSLVLPHPLYTEIEYVNEDKSLSKKTIKKNEAEFFFRLQAKSASGRAVIFEKLNGMPRTQLTQIDL
jgi:hypothetical protein